MNTKIFMILLATLLLTGCVNLDIDQQLYRDGTSNYSLQLQVDIPQAMQGDFEENPASDFEEIEENLRESYGDAYGSNVTATRLDNGFRIDFKRIDLTQEELDIPEEFPMVSNSHVFEEERGFLTNTYRYEIPFGDVENNLLDEDDNSNLDSVSPNMPGAVPQEVDELPEGEELFDEEALADFFNITYTLTVFADIDDTNGELIDSRTVTFNLIEMEENGYIEFSENKISYWFNTLFN